MAVDRITFQVEKGELFGFLGPNGAGKTTTIRMLTGLIKPDAGSASIFGYDIRTEGLKSRQLMGIVPETANAYVDLSAWDNLMLIGGLYGLPRRMRKKRAAELLELFGLHDRSSQRGKGFSKGMKQRLLLCMALINDPQVLFLDEPTSGLDVESQRLIRRMIQEINDNGTTVFLTTHNMEEANQLCRRVGIINRGRIGTIDSPEGIRRKSSGPHSVEVSFNKVVSIESLSEIQCIKEVSRKGDKIRLVADDPGEAIDKIVDYTRSKGLKIVTLNTLSPTLEDVFLELVMERDGMKN